MFNNEKIAEQQVVSVLDFDIHLMRDYKGKRFIERITEIVDTPEIPYPQKYREENEADAKKEAFMETTEEFYRRMTDRRTFETRNIIEFRNGKYIAVQSISKEKIQEMKNRMTEEDIKEFDEYLDKYFG